MAVGCLLIPVLVAAAVYGVVRAQRARASDRLIIPAGEVALVRTLPEPTAALLARFGAGRSIKITGRTPDWRWLEIDLWDGRRGWIVRPLDVLVWTLDASPATPEPPITVPPPVTPVSEKMISIAATSFTMGSPPGFGDDDEHPAHVIQLSAFALDRTEVTIGQYWPCVEARACAAPEYDSGVTLPHYLNDPAFDNHPVVNIPWAEAQHYCQWRGKRLPTEAEWEAAAGWHDGRQAKLLWPWGNTPEGGPGNIGQTARRGPAAVGSFPGDRSPAGVLDMGGNVSEWVFDWYKVDYYRVADTTDPLGPTQRRGAGSGRVVRGGSFAAPLNAARTSNRRHQDAAYGSATIGFRCARSE